MSEHTKPTRKQLNYLRHLADKAGQTFAMPETRKQASAEISRLKACTATPSADGVRERRSLQADLANGAGDASRVRDDELEGYGSTATWR